MDAKQIKRLSPMLNKYLRQFDDCFARKEQAEAIAWDGYRLRSYALLHFENLNGVVVLAYVYYLDRSDS